jgi:alanine racemase
MSLITLDAQNFFYNLEFLCKKAGSKDKIAVVLKDNAYGHGLIEMAKLSKEFGIKQAIVRDIEEANEIKPYFKNILILTTHNIKEFNPNFSYVINDMRDINRFPRYLKIHIKIDTGMNRNGINFEDITNCYESVLKRELLIQGVMTHYRSADEPTDELLWQQNRWKEIKKTITQLTKKYNLKKPLFHSANSATLLRDNQYNDDFARCGIAIYGYHHLDSSFKAPSLKPVLSLYAHKISSKRLKKGDRIGYAGSFKAPKDMTISTYDIGYGDGFMRANSNKNNILGRVSMDSIAIEGEKDKVMIFSDAKKIATELNTISYEIITRLSHKIKRVII